MAKAPDILLLVSDDVNVDIMNRSSCPHIQSLAAGGINFTQAYNYGGSSGAVCQSSRLQMLYGKPWDQLGSGKDTVPFPTRLQRQGYDTFATGKWHSGKGLFNECFRHWNQVFFGGMMSGKSTIEGQRDASGNSSSVLGKRKPGGIFSQSLIQYLQNRPAEGPPCFAYVGFTEPHDPLRDIKPFSSVNQAVLPPNFMPDHPFSFGYRKHRDEKLMKRPLNKKILLKRIHKYMTMVSYLDKCIGNILASLQRPTVVIFTTDNGINMGSHGLLGKQNLYQESIRVPLSVTFLGGAQGAGGSSGQGLVYLHDVYDTILGLANPNYQGEHSLLNKSSIRTSLTCRFKSEIYCVIQEGYKLIYYANIKRYQLFDLNKDPYEKKALSLKKNENIFQSLKKHLKK
jgi:arylsulfatase A-like enzyme